MDRNTKYKKVRNWQQQTLETVWAWHRPSSCGIVSFCLLGFRWGNTSRPDRACQRFQLVFHWSGGNPEVPPGAPPHHELVNGSSRGTATIVCNSCLKFCTHLLLMGLKCSSVQDWFSSQYPAKCEYCGQDAKSLLDLSLEPEVKRIYDKHLHCKTAVAHVHVSVSTLERSGFLLCHFDVDWTCDFVYKRSPFLF